MFRGTTAFRYSRIRPTDERKFCYRHTHTITEYQDVQRNTHLVIPKEGVINGFRRQFYSRSKSLIW